MWCMAPLKMNEGNSLGGGGKGTIGLQAAVPKKPHTRPLTLTCKHCSLFIWTNHFSSLLIVALKMQAACSSGMTVIYPPDKRHTPKDHTLCNTTNYCVIFTTIRLLLVTLWRSIYHNFCMTLNSIILAKGKWFPGPLLVGMHLILIAKVPVRILNP